MTNEIEPAPNAEADRQFSDDSFLCMTLQARMSRAKTQGFDIDTVYYHGTNSTKADKIRREGFRTPYDLARSGETTISMSDFVSLTADESVAFQYAKESARLNGGSAVVLHLYVKDPDLSELDNGESEVMVDFPAHIRSTHDAFDPRDLGCEGALCGDERSDNLSAFEDWFANSKVVDENERPLVVFHGTATEFSEFGEGNPQTEGGSWLRAEGVIVHHFTDSREVALEFAEMVAGADRTCEDKVISVVLSLQNPLVIDAKGRGWVELQNALIRAYKDGTHDGAIFKSVADSGFGESVSDTYVAFSAGQIMFVDSEEFDMKFLRPRAHSSKPSPIKKIRAGTARDIVGHSL